MAILYNKACALSKVGRNDEAMADLQKALDMNAEYVKAYFKRGDILLSMEDYDAAIAEYTKVSEFAPQAPGLREKVKAAKLELKKSKRKDYYKVLNVAKDATEPEIKKAYKKQALMWHPDRHSSKGEEEIKHAENMFKELGEGYEILSDPKKKSMYDQGMDLEEIN